MLQRTSTLLLRLVAIACILAPAPARAADHTAPQDPPIQLGVSGGNAADSTRRFCCGGTLGALIDLDGQQWILSNNHVLARTNRARRREPIIQPGLVDAQCNPDLAQRVATFRRNFVPLGDFNVDAAVAKAAPGMVDPSGAILDIGVPCDSPAAAFVGMSVQKSGRNGVTTGTVDAIDVTVDVDYQPRCNAGATFTVTYTNQLAIGPQSFSDAGDSGALILSSDFHPVGLLTAGTSTETIANPAQDVIDAFQAQGHSFGFVGSACPSSAAATPSAAARAELAAARRTKQRHETTLRAQPGVIGVGVGRASGDPATRELAIVVYVDAAHQPPADLPAELDGLKVRVIRTQRFVAR